MTLRPYQTTDDAILRKNRLFIKVSDCRVVERVWKALN